MLHIKHINAPSSHQNDVRPLSGINYDFGRGAKAVFKSGILPLEARITCRNNLYYLYNVGRSSTVLVDGVAVKGETPLRAGMILTVGKDQFALSAQNTQVNTPAQAGNIRHGATQWSLKALNSKLSDKIIPLTESQSIGRADYCDICLKVAHLSRRHAQLNVVDGQVEVRDLDSSNGTFLNGKRIAFAKVISKDELTFDTLRFLVVGPEDVFDGDRTALRVDAAFNADKTVARSFGDKRSNVLSVQSAAASSDSEHAKESSKPPPSARSLSQADKAPIDIEPDSLSKSASSLSHTLEKNPKGKIKLRDKNERSDLNRVQKAEPKSEKKARAKKSKSESFETGGLAAVKRALSGKNTHSKDKLTQQSENSDGILIYVLGSVAAITCVTIASVLYVIY